MSESLKDRIFSVMDTVTEKKLGDFEARIDSNIDSILKAKETEISKGLHKGFGLEHDPIVHESDLIGLGRKLALEKSEPNKRTPATESPGPDGNVPESPVKKMFDKARQGDLS